MKKLLFFFFIFCSLQFVAQEKTDSIKKWEIEGKFTFLFNQASFSNWVSGGDNSISGNLTINYDFDYKSVKWNWDNKIITSYGLRHLDKKGIQKTNDRFEYNMLLGYKISNYWFTSLFSNFITQYTVGYDYKKRPKKRISNFFAPAYWGFGPGFLWKKSKNSSINIAPATARFTFVTNEFSGLYGVEKGKNSVLGLGFNLSAYFKFTIMQNVEMENILAMYSDYLEKPENIDVNYQINFFVKANKYLSMNLGLHMIMDADASGDPQFKETFGLGVNYIFHKR